MSTPPPGTDSPVRVTLDTNAIIDLEEDRESATALRELVALHRKGEIILCVSAIAAGERSRNAQGEPDFAQFIAKLARAGLEEAQLLLPTMHWGITFWDQAIFAELDDTLETDVLEVLFPGKTIRGDYPGETDFQRLGKDVNPLCDAITMWCHIHYHGDIFVTRDERFHQETKKPRLIELGARQILRPSEVMPFLRSLREAAALRALTPQVVADLARDGDTDAARSILQDFVEAIALSDDRAWHDKVPWPHAKYIAAAFDKLLTGESDAAKALGIKTSRPGRRTGSKTHDDVRLAAAYWLIVRRGRGPEEANTILQTDANANRTTIQRAASANEAFEDPALFSDETLIAVISGHASLSRLIERLFAPSPH